MHVSYTCVMRHIKNNNNMKTTNFLSTLVLAISMTACGQTNSKDSTKDGIKYDEKQLSSPTTNLTAAEYYNKGYKAFHSGDYHNAIKLYRKAIELDPKYTDAYDNCGISYRRIGNLDSAAYFYKESIKINPKAAIAHGNLAIIYEEKGQLENAINEYEEITKYNPNDPEAPYGIAGVYLQSGQYEKALASAKKSAELFEKYQPQYVGDAYYYVGLSYLRLNDKINAKEYIQKAINKGTSVSAEIKAQLGLM
jgi:tetratricopeptide (TPR) repeat protein